MLRMCVYIHSRFVENHPIRILEDGPLISEGVLSHSSGSLIGTDSGFKGLFPSPSFVLQNWRPLRNYCKFITKLIVI
jgi:hypothetical protein